MNTFWTNTIWFLLLGLSTLIELVLVMMKKKNRGFFYAFYFTLLGLPCYFEMVTYFFFKAYMYYPKILPNPNEDSLLGNLFSQTSVSATMLLVAALRIKYRWYFPIAGAYCLIEEFFLAMHIYKHNWYQTWMTFVGLLLAFWIARKMYEFINRDLRPIYYYGYILLGLYPLFNAILIWCLTLLKLQDFSTTLFHDPMISRHFLFQARFLLVAFPIMFIYFSKCNWKWSSLIILMLYGLHYWGYKLHLIIVKEGWWLATTSIAIGGMYLLVCIMDKLYRRDKLLLVSPGS